MLEKIVRNANVKRNVTAVDITGAVVVVAKKIKR